MLTERILYSAQTITKKKGAPKKNKKRSDPNNKYSDDVDASSDESDDEVNQDEQVEDDESPRDEEEDNAQHTQDAEHAQTHEKPTEHTGSPSSGNDEDEHTNTPPVATMQTQDSSATGDVTHIEQQTTRAHEVQLTTATAVSDDSALTEEDQGYILDQPQIKASLEKGLCALVTKDIFKKAKFKMDAAVAKKVCRYAVDKNKLEGYPSEVESEIFGEKFYKVVWNRQKELRANAMSSAKYKFESK